MRVAHFDALHGQVGLHGDTLGDVVANRGRQNVVKRQFYQYLDDALDCYVVGRQARDFGILRTWSALFNRFDRVRPQG